MSTMETPIEIPDLRKPGATSLEGLHGSVSVPPTSAGFWRQMRAFAGPAFLVSVGYMDPGNWGTDLQAGAQYRYGLLWVVGVGQPDGDRYADPLRPAGHGRRARIWPRPAAIIIRAGPAGRTGWPAKSPSALATWPRCSAAPWPSTFSSTSRCSGPSSSPLSTCCCCSACKGLGMRVIEAVILVLVATIGVCYFVEIFVLPQTQPSFSEMGPRLLTPGFRQKACSCWRSASSGRR